MSLARNSRFQRGSAVYTCRVCKHNTRDTGGDGSGVQLCDTCFELSGEENHISDSSDGETFGSKANVTALLAQLDKRSGAGTAMKHFDTVCAAVGYGKVEEPAAAAVPVDREQQLVALLLEAQKLGLRFDIGTAYIRRSYIDEQEALNKRIAAILKA